MFQEWKTAYMYIWNSQKWANSNYICYTQVFTQRSQPSYILKMFYPCWSPDAVGFSFTLFTCSSWHHNNTKKSRPNVPVLNRSNISINIFLAHRQSLMLRACICLGTSLRNSVSCLVLLRLHPATANQKVTVPRTANQRLTIILFVLTALRGL